MVGVRSISSPGLRSASGRSVSLTGGAAAM